MSAPSGRRGFTLVEVLMVLVLMGILLAMTVKVSAPKRAVYMAMMKSDLRNIAGAQESYFADNGVYASSAADLGFQPSEKVSVRVRGNVAGWSARTDHEIRTDYRCALFMGDISPHSPATEEGLMACEPTSGGSGCSGR